MFPQMWINETKHERGGKFLRINSIQIPSTQINSILKKIQVLFLNFFEGIETRYNQGKMRSFLLLC